MDPIINCQQLENHREISILEKVCPELIDHSTTQQAMLKYILTRD